MKNVMDLVKLSFNNYLSIKKMSLFIIVAFSISSLFNPVFSVMLIAMISYVVAYQTMAYEDTYGIDHMISYLPVTKKQYVISRYVFNLLTILGAVVFFTLIYFLGQKINMSEGEMIDYKTSLFMGVLSSIALISILIPILLYFGMKKGRMAMILIFIVVGMMPSMILNDSKILEDIVLNLSKINLTLLSSLTSIIMLIISYFITKYLYLRKEII